MNEQQQKSFDIKVIKNIDIDDVKYTYNFNFFIDNEDKDLHDFLSFCVTVTKSIVYQKLTLNKYENLFDDFKFENQDILLNEMDKISNHIDKDYFKYIESGKKISEYSQLKERTLKITKLLKIQK